MPGPCTNKCEPENKTKYVEKRMPGPAEKQKLK